MVLWSLESVARFFVVPRVRQDLSLTRGLTSCCGALDWVWCSVVNKRGQISVGVLRSHFEGHLYNPLLGIVTGAITAIGAGHRQMHLVPEASPCRGRNVVGANQGVQ